jgi:hypothetical protein
MGRPSSSSELGLPDVGDFEILKETFVELGYGGWSTAHAVPNDQNGLFVKAEKLCIDLDFLVWPPYTICLNGIVRTKPWGSSLVVRYREFTHNSQTENTSINHDYILRTEFGELVEFGQSILVCPDIKSPATEIDTLLSDEKLDQVAEGERIIKQNTGNLLEITSGDCGILFDRMVSLMY